MAHMEGDNCSARQGTEDEDLPSVVAKDPLEKVIAQGGIAQATLVFYRHKRKTFLEGPGEETLSGAARHAPRIVELDPRDPATRRILLEDVSREVRFFKCLELSLGKRSQRHGQVPLGRDRHESRPAGVADQTHRFTRSAESCLHFWADRNPLDMPTQHIRQK